MSYSRHLSMDEIERIWSKEKNSPYGVWIGNDLLISGRYIENVECGIDTEDITDECGDFSEDGYYIIRDINGYNYSSITEVSRESDLTYYYYN